jgi:hemolysin III
MEKSSFYTKGEDIANAITHGIGALLAIVALVVLIEYSFASGNLWSKVSYTIFGSTLLLMYTQSTLYHSLTHKKAKRLFRIFDHASIYLLIAGTYTPFTLTVLRSTLGWVIFVIVWLLAILGIIIKALCVGKHDKLATLMYVFMGWIIIISIRRLWILLPTNAFVLLVAGGLFYTSGVILYLLDKIPYNHAIWHIFVLAGSMCHFFSVIFMT